MHCVPCTWPAHEFTGGRERLAGVVVVLTIAVSEVTIGFVAEVPVLTVKIGAEVIVVDDRLSEVDEVASTDADVTIVAVVELLVVAVVH